MRYNGSAWLRLLSFLFNGKENIPEGKTTHWSESILSTDGYKFSMFLGGRPLEDEVFYLSFRKSASGTLDMPVDLRKTLEELVPTIGVSDIEAEAAWLKSKSFPVTANMLWPIARPEMAKILYATPKNDVAAPREPVLTIQGPQALVSWLEPLLIGRLSYQMQIATAFCDMPRAEFIKRTATVTCEEQKRLTIEAIRGVGAPEAVVLRYEYFIQVDMQGYYNAVQEQCRKLLATGVDPNRIFEVGLRAATCMEQHLIALKAMKDMGFTRTSNVFGAWLLDLVPVGTLGHEGIGRWGGDDELCFRKHIEALPKVTFLLDTTDTLKVGMPLAFRLFKEFPERMDSARPDSGDLTLQFRAWVQGLKDHGLPPHPWIFEDGLDDTSVAGFEALRQELDYPAAMTLYGLGGYFIDRCEPTGFGRGCINMIYKLSWSLKYGATMKFGNELESGESGKQSLPGKPVLVVDPKHGAHIMVAQAGTIPDGYRIYRSEDRVCRSGPPKSRPEVCSFTNDIITICKTQRQDAILKASVLKASVFNPSESV